jgi:prepilin signal peptidase PulO-like enzyme (type II secretory pathway)
MIVAVLIVTGLCFGSFVNALVWRLHEQSRTGKKADRQLSILHGRSLCPDCRHQLSALDLVPVFSWLSLRGRCRYCRKPISKQYPIVELGTAVLFVGSYLLWPADLAGAQTILFVLWLGLLVGFMALTVYDLRWMLLPNRIVYPLSLLAVAHAVVRVAAAPSPLHQLLDTAGAVAVGGGIFYLLYQVSNGKWIGGGDVRLGWLLGLTVATPQDSLLFIFLGSIAGTLISLPLLANHRLKSKSLIPFGPLLILGAIVVQLLGADIWTWYRHIMLMS